MSDVLLMSLQAAVPLWIAESRGRPELLEEWRVGAVEAIANHGDALLYRTPGRTAETFNALARAIAVLAHAPGGVSAFGAQWCATHSPGGVPATGGGVCAGCRATGRSR